VSDLGNVSGVWPDGEGSADGAMRRVAKPVESDGRPQSGNRRPMRRAMLPFVGIIVLPLVAATLPSVAQAQNWGGWIPWGDQRPPVPREPMRQPPQPIPQQPLPPSQPPAYQTMPAPPQANYGSSGRQPICVQLEQRLFAESRSNSAREMLPRIENDMRLVERDMRAAQERLERSNCYEYEFLMFGKSLRRTPVCQGHASLAESNRKRLAELEQQRQQIIQSGGRSRQDDLVRELARNNCGPSYQQQAARLNNNPFSFLWQDEDSGPGGNSFNYGTTYRTVCVRLCDGAFFPVSFSTMQNQFDRDQDLCQQQCAAPAELYYHLQSPGHGMEQAISHKTRQPYTGLRTAFRFRKEFVNGCSCKAAEYSAPATSGPASFPPGDRRAEAPPFSGERAPDAPRR